MTETATLALVCLAGAGLGAVFFGGLWWTVRRGASAGQPALWFFASFLLRTSIVVVGFLVICGGRWERLLVCLVGFVVARPIVTRLTRPFVEAHDAS
jgi:F1F0 ATPase subunit 2